jgi:hypothetical protein
MTMNYDLVEYIVGRSTLRLILGDDHLRVMGSHLCFFCRDLQRALISVTGGCVDRDPRSILSGEFIKDFLWLMESNRESQILWLHKLGR